MKLADKNYYSRDMAYKYASFSQFKSFCGTGKTKGCEAHALAVLNNEWEDDVGDALIEGGYVDAYFEGTLDKFLERNQDRIFNKKGEKYANYKRCDEAIERCLRDKLFMQFMDGEKQKIFTYELFGMEWKSKLDVYHKDKLIVDLKYIKNIRETYYVPDFGRVSWIEYFGYDTQGALYQKAVELNTGKKLPYYIAVVDKGKYPDIAIIQIPNRVLDNALSLVEYQSKRYKAVKLEGAEPDRCEDCDYCKATKILTAPLSLDELMI